MEIRQLPPFGEPMFIHEITGAKSDCFQEKSVRVTGKLSQYDYSTGLATLQEPRSEKTLSVCTRLIEPFSACVGEIVQFIGELDFRSEEPHVILQARAVRRVGDLDLTMYQKALGQQRTFLRERFNNT